MSKQNTNTDFENIYRKEYPRLLGYIRKHFQSEYGWMDEEDVLQEVALNVFNKLDPAYPIENLSGYVYSAITNRIRDLFRRKKQNTVSLENLHNLIDIAEDDDLKQSLYQHPEILQAMLIAIKNLPDFERELIEKTSFEGYSHQQLSDEWDIPVGTLLSRKHRTLAKLQQELAPLAQKIINS